MIKFPLSTEKSIRLMEAQNKLIFVVVRQMKKPEIKEELEKLLSVKIDKVNTLVDKKGNKKAYVTFSADNPAIDVATKLGLM